MDIEKVFYKIKNGSKAEMNEAKKEIKQNWNAGRGDKIRKNAKIVFKEMASFDQIKCPINQAGFITSLDMLFLVLSDENFDIFKDFTLKIIQSPNGQVRETIRKISSWLYVSLSARAVPFLYQRDITEKEKQQKQIAEKQFLKYVEEIEDLIAKYKSHDKTKYIEDMKPSVEKSLQMLLQDITRGLSYKEIKRKHSAIDKSIPMGLIEKRWEIEDELTLLLNEAKSRRTIEEIKDIIYNETSQKDLQKIIKIFDTLFDGKDEFNLIAQTVNDAWNYFPHKLLNGQSPMEKLS